MKEIEKRLAKIQTSLAKRHQHKCIEDMTTDELAQVITGNPDTKASDLSVEYLKAIMREARQ